MKKLVVLVAAVWSALLQVGTPAGTDAPAASRLAAPILVYNNWSAYDELSDHVPLTEELALREPA